MTAISAMMVLATQPWSHEVQMANRYTFGYLDRVTLNVYKTSPRLQTGHIVLALYDSISKLYSRRLRFCKVICSIVLQGSVVGSVFITRSSDGPGLSDGRQDTTVGPKGIEEDLSLVNRSSLTANSGEISAPGDPEYRIYWNVNGRPVLPQDILSAGVDGMATAAQYELLGPLPYITGVSFSGNAVFHIGQSHGAEFSCFDVITAISSLIGQVVVGQRKFREMEFTVKYHGAQTGTGYIMSLSPAGGFKSNGTGGVATS